MTNYPHHATANGYLTEKIRSKYIQYAIKSQLLPENAHRIPHIISLTASDDLNTPIQFWQLYSVLGQQRITAIVRNFYQRVFADEQWFTSVFERVGGLEHHTRTQSSMWIDVMGGGLAYHGGEYRLSFHHTHNAMQLMNNKGALQWVNLMVDTLNDPVIDMTDDPRVRPAINTFLSYFLSKYAEEFGFSIEEHFGTINQPVIRKINFMNMTSDAIEALTERELRDALQVRGVDVSQYEEKQELVNHALRL